MSKTTVVIGGGISGLVAACVLAGQGERVTLMESERQLGGLLRKLDYGEHGVFDCGMHNMYDTGIADLDDFLFGLLPADQWQLLEGEKRDLAGVYVDGRLQSNSPYIDLRSQSEDARREQFGDLMLSVAQAEPGASLSAGAFARQHFGAAIARHAIQPAMQKLFRCDPDELDPFASRLTPLTRVVMFDEETQLDLMQSDKLRSRLAFPQQRDLPLKWSANRRSYYPRRYGIYRVIDALSKRLANSGGRILCNAKLTSLESSGGHIASVGYSIDGTIGHIPDVQHLVWTVSMPALAPMLGITLSGAQPDKPLRTVVTNLLLRSPARMGDLYYFYCYDAAFDCFRVTDYTAYCDGAVREGGRALCHEMLVDDPALATPQVLEQRAVAELLGMGVIADRDEVAFARTEILAGGFPMPTLNNSAILGRLRDQIRALGLGNLLLSGIMAEPGLFFQRDVLAHVYGLVKKT